MTHPGPLSFSSVPCCFSQPLTIGMSVSDESPGQARRSVAETLAQLQSKLSVAQDSLTKKNREIDHLTLQHSKEAAHLRSLFAHYLLRLHVRSHKTKRILMQLHLTAMEMEESLAREEQRATTNSGELVVYDEKHMVSKTTLRKLAHLYRKRPLHITAELDDKFTHEIKGKFFYFLNNYQSVVRENESLFLRNVALTKETLDYKQQADDDRKERDRAVKDATDKAERLEAVTREADELRRRVSKMERDDELRRKKEAARAVQARTEQYSKGFRGVAMTVDVGEEKEGVSGSDSPLSPTPRSPTLAGLQASAGLLLALSPSASTSSKRLTAGSGGLPSLEVLPPPSPKVAPHPLATPTQTNKSGKRSTANARQLASINTKRSDSPRAADKLTASPLTPATPSSAKDKSPKVSGREESKHSTTGGSGSSLPAIVSPRGGKR